MTSRRTFGPVVLLGLAGSGGAAIAGHKPWASVTALGDADPLAGALAEQTGRSAGDVPLAGALALVALACWGVVLVARGRFRRAVAALAALAALGVVVVWVEALLSIQDEVVDAWTGTGDTIATGFTGWFWVTAAAAVLALTAGVAAVRLVPQWPEMGTRYDAPSAAHAETPPPGQRSSLDLWKALDEGQDPT